MGTNLGLNWVNHGFLGFGVPGCEIVEVELDMDVSR